MATALLTSCVVALGGPPGASAQPASTAQPSVGTSIVNPETFFGFPMGADGRLAPWTDIERYFRRVADESARVELVSLGMTTEGQNYIAAVVSASENIARLEEIRRDNLRLADPRTLPPDGARQLAATQKVMLAIGASIHASEVGATQAAPELLHSLVSATDAETLTVLDNVVTVIIPSLNPDGHRLVSDWYAQTKGTADGSSTGRTTSPSASATR